MSVCDQCVRALKDETMTLAEALANVELEAGKKYHCVVKGKPVTIEVAPASQIAPSAAYDESDVMLDAWCGLPSQGRREPAVNVRIGKIPLDIPEIPQDAE
jgi:hypothetical protein